MKTMILLPLAFVMTMSATIMAEHWPTGYYRAVSAPESSYFYHDEFRWFCHVQNDTQADLFNVESQVRIVGDLGFLGQGVDLGECPWPNGFYRLSNSDGPVFRLYPGNICAITSNEMLAAYGGTDYVIYTEENSDFAAKRTYIGQCFWPSYDIDIPRQTLP